MIGDNRWTAEMLEVGKRRLIRRQADGQLLGSCHWCMSTPDGMAKHPDAPEPIVECCEPCGTALGVGFRTYKDLDQLLPITSPISEAYGD